MDLVARPNKMNFTGLPLSDFDYFLPRELIAQTPLQQRTSSRLMVLNRAGRLIQDDVFKNLIKYLNSGDLLVLNNTRVIPARLFGKINNYDKDVETFLLKQINEQKNCSTWECLVRPGKKFKTGTKLEFAQNFEGEVVSINPDGTRQIKFNQRDITPFLDKYGEMPLPPYIKEKLEDQERYQTVYSGQPGSVAAPTAGLHFTEDYLDQLQQKGINIACITLDVGLGTFQPVKTDDIKKHKMHSERFELTQDVVDMINQTKKAGKKVIAVGTTSVRVLESSLNRQGNLIAQKGETDIFIYPPYKFKTVDAMLTNFHLPKSTLLMLVSAFAERELIFEAYQKAIDLNYRFFSFGDAMLIL